MRCRLRGKYYKLQFARLKRPFMGFCNWDERTITIADRLTGESELDTILHELLHACQPDLAEDTVDETATDVARILWRLGYRRSTAETPPTP
jgi:hypothetical protein